MRKIIYYGISSDAPFLPKGHFAFLVSGSLSVVLGCCWSSGEGRPYRSKMADPVQDALLGDTSGSDVEPRLSSAELCGVDDTARLRWDGPRRRVDGRQQPPAHHRCLATDHDAIICLMTDRLTAVQIKMFTSRAWAATSALLDVFCYLLYRWEKLVSYRR